MASRLPHQRASFRSERTGPLIQPFRPSKRWPGRTPRRGIGRQLDSWYSGAMQVGDSRRRGDTRERILELAEAAVLAKGFAATSIDELIAAVGITKSGFFYHFKDKGELAR